MGKSKERQIAIVEQLAFDLQKTDVDEQINLVSTLGNMLGQNEQAKMEKIIETMPTIIQTHWIIEPNWKMVIKKAKDLKHIICKCEAPAIAASSLQGAGAVPNLYSHIAQLQDQDAVSILKPFKSTKGRGGKKSGKGKQKSQQQPQLPPPPPRKGSNMKRQVIIITMKIIEAILEAADPIGANKVVIKSLKEVPNKGEGASKTIIGDNTKATMGNITLPAEAITIIIIMVIIEVEVDMALVIIITEVVATDEAVIKAIIITNITNISLMMMAHRWSNTTHHTHFAVVLLP